MTPKTTLPLCPVSRPVLAALLVSASLLPGAPLAAQSSPSLFQQAPGAGGPSGASLFPQDDLNAAAGISVGIEAPVPPAPEVSEEMAEEVPVTDAPLVETPATDTPLTVAEPAPQAEVAQSPESLAAARALETVTSGGENPEPVATEPEVIRTSAVLPASIRPRLRPEALALEATPAAATCTDPAAVRDRDVQRNLGAFQVDQTLCISEERFAEHGRNWHMVVIENRKVRRGPVWAILHDNEDSAFDAALYSVSRYGGKMIALETGEGRSFAGQDPNRNFGATSKITAPCRNMASRPAPAFTKAISRHFNRNFPVLTMHSNDNGYAGNGGSGHISARRSSATMKGIMSPAPRGSLSDEDNAVLTAGTVPFEQNAKAQQLAQYLGGQGINMIYEHVRTNTNDCSFSFHVKLNKLGDYYNIEVEHGRVEDQKQILDALMGYLGIKPRR